MAASCLHLPSKSHRGIEKIFAQVNSLLKIIAKMSSEPRKSFSSYVYTNRVVHLENKLLKTKSLLTSPSNVLPYYLK
jgi:hypothetical protein